MPIPHDYYDHNSPEPHLHNRHNHAPYIEPDWQANLAKDQLPDLSTIGRGPRGAGLLLGNVNQSSDRVSFSLISDLTGEVVGTIGPFPTGTIEIEGIPEHTPIAGENWSFDIKYSAYENSEVVSKRTTIEVPCGATGSLIYLYPGTLDRTNDDTYQVEEKDLRIYNKTRYPGKPPVRVNDLVFLQTHKRIPATNTKKAYDQYWLTFGTVEAVESGQVVFTARTFYGLNAHVSWNDVENKPEFSSVAFSGEYSDLKNTPQLADVATSGSYTDLSDTPTKVSQFKNDSDYQTGAQVSEAINTAVSSVYRYKGSVETYEDLPNNASNGDVYNVRQAHEGYPAGTNYAWDEESEVWDPLAGAVDLDGYATEEYVDNAASQLSDYVDTKSTQTLNDAKDYTDNAVSQLSGDYNKLTNKPLSMKDNTVDLSWDSSTSSKTLKQFVEDDLDHWAATYTSIDEFPVYVVVRDEAAPNGIRKVLCLYDRQAMQLVDATTYQPFDYEANDSVALIVLDPEDPYKIIWAGEPSTASFELWDKLDHPAFATVATSGSYNDLSDKPEISGGTFIATYNETSYEDIVAAYDEGKAIYLAITPGSEAVQHVYPCEIQINRGPLISLNEHNTILTIICYTANIEAPFIAIQFVVFRGDGWAEARTKNIQEALVSGTNIKTINNESILGSGNLDVTPDLTGYIKRVNLTESEYAALTEKDHNTVYVVEPDPAP